VHYGFLFLVAFSLLKGDSFNDMGTMLFSPSSSVLPMLFSRVNGIFSVGALITFAGIFFILAVITSGMWIAGGLFIPMMMIGACMGRIVGRAVSELFPEVQPPIDPSIYAVVGSVGVMTGFCRMTISIVVVYAELTETTQYLLPIILVVMTSKWTADFFGSSIYERLLDLKRIPFMHFDNDHQNLHQPSSHHPGNIQLAEIPTGNSVLTVDDVMSSIVRKPVQNKL
jgi:H+/Cl- antiporter ClcA